jgi:two-component system nitrogen regulation sensor histidine kinase NtrY
MSVSIRGALSAGVQKGRSSWRWVVLSVIGLLFLSRGAEYLLLGHYEADWERIANAKCQEYLTAATRAFVGVQRATRRVATELAQSPTLQAYFTGALDDRASLFEQISRVSREQNLGIEIYGKSGQLLAWEGLSGPPHAFEVAAALEGRFSSYVSRSPVYAQLFVASPIRAGGAVVGAILVRRMVEVNYPFSTRYFESQGLTEFLSRDLGVPVDFDFSLSAELRKDGRYSSSVLYGFDSTKVGVVSVLRPVRSAYLETIDHYFQQVNACLLIILVGIAVTAVGVWTGRVSSLLSRSVIVTVLVWLSRYLLLWLDIPSMFFSGGIFDPAFFASKFGGGIAKSIAELAITAVALQVNVIVIALMVARRVSRVSPWWHPSSSLLRWLLVLGSPLLLFLLVRGFAAAIRSAVFDSSLNYGDPGIIVPSFEMALMAVTLLLLSFSLVIAAVGLTSFTYSLLHGKDDRGRGWITLGILYGLGVLVFGIIHPNPLTGPWYRLLFGAIVIGLAYYLHSLPWRRKPVATFNSFLLSLATSVMCLYPLQGQMVREKERDVAGVLAGQVLRPVDSWLKFLVEDALKGFTSGEALDILLTGRPEQVERLPFTRWARSTVGKEGYASYFALFSANGTIMGEFRIGSQSYLVAQLFAGRAPPHEKVVQAGRIGSGANAADVYGGWTPIVDKDQILGYALVAVIAGQQPLFREAGPPIFRAAPQQGLESFSRPTILSEYRDGRLVSSESNSLPIGFQLPSDVQAAFRDARIGSVWTNENIDNKEYETLFARGSQVDGRVVALAIERPDLAWRVVNFVKLLLDSSVIVIVVFVASLVAGWWRGSRYVFRFRDKLLVALLVTSVVPLVALAWYGRVYAGRRMLEKTAKELETETGAVVANVSEPPDSPSSAGGPIVNSWAAEQLAADFGTDFNVYRGMTLQVSSRPELYEAGLLDRRLSGSAYANIVLLGKRFYIERENIGLYQYVVGYRPLLDRDGQVVGIVSVPTLYRQDEVDEDISRQNAFLFGLFAIVLLVILVVATTFANRIAAPVHSLTQATKRVAQGDLDVRFKLPESEGEVGELMRSFETMTTDLKRNRESLIRFERELAWKEMARQVAHEIKNPLTPMKLSIQHLRQTYKDKAPDFDRILEEVSTTIIAQVEALSRIASEFSHFGRMPKAQLERCDVHAVIKEAVALFGTEGAIQIETGLYAEAAYVLADHEELRRAFINIIRNGIQAMNNVGRMLIATSNEKKQVVISFRDFGGGIPPDVRDRLFQPNFSTKTDGMGLGLAIVKQTIDDLGGTIDVESEMEKGTLVTLRIPAAA